MTLRITRAALDAAEAHARAGYPHEVTGILAGDRGSWTVTEVAALHNERSDSPHNRYQVSGLALQRASDALEARGLEIVGYYHSHPDHPADASETDRDHAWPAMAYPILSVRDGVVADLKCWRLRDDRSAMDEEPVQITEER